jgi:hypothetical protein
MKPPKHSKAAIKAYPAPVRSAILHGSDYAMACLDVHDARIRFDAGKKTKEQVINRIVAGLAEGETLRAMCRENGMPNYSTVYDWIKADAEISQRIACAREAGYDCISEQILEIIDDSSFDTIANDEGVERTNSEVVARSKLRAEMRLKLLAKWSPKKYGDKLAIGGDADAPPIQQSLTISFK